MQSALRLCVHVCLFTYINLQVRVHIHTLILSHRHLVAMFPFEIAYEIAEGGMFKSRAEGGGGLIVITDNQKLLFGSFFFALFWYHDLTLFHSLYAAFTTAALESKTQCENILAILILEHLYAFSRFQICVCVRVRCSYRRVRSLCV